MPKTTYVWDELSDNVIEEYEGGVLTASYSHEPGFYGNLLRQNRSGTTHYYHYDGRGDTVALTNDAGIVTDTKEYDAWGNVIASTGTAVTPYQFLGRIGVYRDSVTQLLVRRSRPYQPSTGRWITLGALSRRVVRLATYAVNRSRPLATVDFSSTLDDDSSKKGGEDAGPLSVLIETTTSPKTLKCGEDIEVAWKFSLSQEAPCNGFMIQRVNVSCKIVECACQNKDVFDSENIHPSTAYTYYEAWRVRHGKTNPVTLNGVDRFLSTPVACRRGKYVQQGEVRFYCNTDVGLDEETTNESIPNWTPSGTKVFYPPDSASDDCKTTAGTLQSTGDQPTFWDGFGTNSRAKLAYRRAWLNWECCPRNDRCKDGYGTEEIAVDVLTDPEETK